MVDPGTGLLKSLVLTQINGQLIQFSPDIFSAPLHLRVQVLEPGTRFVWVQFEPSTKTCWDKTVSKQGGDVCVDVFYEGFTVCLQTSRQWKTLNIDNAHLQSA